MTDCLLCLNLLPSTSDESNSHLKNKNISKPVICSTSKLISDASSDTEERIKQNSPNKVGELEAIVKKQSLQIASLMEKQPHVDSVLQQFTSFQKRMSDLENSISNLIDQRFTELMSRIDISTSLVNWNVYNIPSKILFMTTLSHCKELEF